MRRKLKNIYVRPAYVPLVQACEELGKSQGMAFSEVVMDALKAWRRNIVRRKHPLDDGTACRYIED